MGFNPYKWYSKGKTHRPLPKSSPLLSKIRNGDYEISSYLVEADDVKKDYIKIYSKEYNSHTTNDESTRKFHAHQKARMRNVAYLKLLESGMMDEERILKDLRNELYSEFGGDYWETVLDGEPMTIEDMYWMYKKLSGMGTTPSEMALQLGRKSTKGLKPKN
jgi:hypothetical protein